MDLHGHDECWTRCQDIQAPQYQICSNIQGVPIENILKHADWSNHRTFDRFYNKPVREGSLFADSVLKVD